jgi:hypothetical protein
MECLSPALDEVVAVRMGPGSAKRYCAPHRVRDTKSHVARSYLIHPVASAAASSGWPLRRASAAIAS